MRPPAHPVSRRSALALPPIALAASQLAAVPPAFAGHQAPAHGRSRRTRALAIRGADISFTLQEEAAGVRYSDRGKVRPVEQILAKHGANYVRLRVWTNPPAGYSTEASALTLARRAKQGGHEDPARPALLRLLGRPRQAADPGRLAGTGPAHARHDRARPTRATSCATSPGRAPRST